MGLKTTTMHCAWINELSSQHMVLAHFGQEMDKVKDSLIQKANKATSKTSSKLECEVNEDLISNDDSHTRLFWMQVTVAFLSASCLSAVGVYHLMVSLYEPGNFAIQANSNTFQESRLMNMPKLNLHLNDGSLWQVYLNQGKKKTFKFLAWPGKLTI